MSHGLNDEEFKKVRKGLTSEEAEELYKTVGFNELPVVEVSLLWLFFAQFTGLMPYMLELAAVLSLATEDWIDFIIIFIIIMANGILGFTEEMKAAASLAELTAKMEARVAVLRDGKAETLLTRLLVPGDVLLLTGGTAVPADVDWIEGDILSIDTAALTGEPIPRKYPSEQHGNLILAGTIVAAGEAYCVVRKTGINTEVGGAQAEIMQDKTETKVSVFEERILYAVKVLISISLVDVFIILLIQGVARNQFSDGETSDVIATCLSIIIAAVPVALPLVLQVTLALGAGLMAKEYSAVVTSLPSLQDIASMTILCSDKTGTLTTAHITIIKEKVWTNPLSTFTAEDVALYGVLGSNRDKKEDAVDRSVVDFFDRTATPQMSAATLQYTKVRNVGFSPIYKRVVWEYTHPNKGRVTIAKGLVNKCIDTEAGSPDDAEDQWKVENHEKLMPIASKTDVDFATVGYKTLGVSVKFNDGPWQFVGIMPMLDPPRHDTAKTVKLLQDSGIEVKMCTGDHLNIAKETARLINMGTNIHKGESTRGNNKETFELIKNADGFAQVLPKDKREVVQILRNEYKEVIGMTGDGVNDAPALSAAQCGIAVDDATDAAKNAAAILLTAPGLSAIYSAVVESRKIFRKLKSYVIYRFSATIQIVVVLSFLIFVSNCSVKSLYIILLALFNDLSLLPIAYDTQRASKQPEKPDVDKILIASTVLGLLQTVFSLIWAYGLQNSGILHDTDFSLESCETEAQSSVWVQMFISAEFVIFATRCSGFTATSLKPSTMLFVSVISFCLLVSLLAVVIDKFGGLAAADVVIIWVYCIICFFILDCVKVYMNKLFNEDPRVLDEVILTGKDSAASHTLSPEEEEPVSMRRESMAMRMTLGDGTNAQYTYGRSSIVATRRSSLAPTRLEDVRSSMSKNRSGLRESLISGGHLQSDGTGGAAGANRGSFAVSSASLGHSDMRRSIASASLKPNTPAGVSSGRKGFLRRK